MTLNNKMYDTILEFIIRHQAETGLIPSVREIGQAVNLSSTCTVAYYLKKLEEQGKIKKLDKKSRAILIAKENKPNFQPISTLSNSYVEIPLIGTVAAGVPIMAEENYEEVYKVPSNMFSLGGVMFMLTVKGDSMVNIGMNDGDRIVVRKQATASNGEIIVAMVDDSATVKRFYKEKDRIRLQPENDFMQPMYFDSVEILGKVVGLIRNY